MSFNFKDKNVMDIGKKSGKEFAKGLGVGMNEESYRAITTMEDVYVELENLTKNAAKNAEKLEKKRQERKLDNLKNSLKLELICEQEYYERLKIFRDENLRQGSDMWYKCTEEIAEYNQQLLEETQKQYDKIIELREELTEKLSKKLLGNEPWLATDRVTFKGMGVNGTDLVYSDNELKSFREEILLLEDYRNKLMELKKLGNVPQGVFSDIAAMSVEQGLQAAIAILQTNTADRNRFFTEYIEHQSTAGSISAELLEVLYGNELNAAANLGTYAGGAELVNKGKDKNGLAKLLEVSFEYVPEDYYSLGEEAGSAFGEGFLSRVPEIVEEMGNYFTSAINELGGQLAAVLRQGVNETLAEVRNTYNTSYTFNASKDTTTQQLNAARNAATLQRLRGGNG